MIEPAVKLFFVEGEVLEVLHVVDVHVQHVDRDVELVQFANDVFEVVLRLVAPAALPVAERELWRFVAFANGVAELPDDVENRFPLQSNTA